MKIEKYIVKIYIRNNKKSIAEFETYNEKDIDDFFKNMNDSSTRFLKFGPLGINKVEFSYCEIKVKKSRK